MRPLLLVVVLACSGCGVQRTMTQAEADALKARAAAQASHDAGFQRGARHSQSGEPEVYVHPEFTASIDEVQDAVLRACMSYYKRVDEDDRKARRVVVHNQTAWAGFSDVTISLRPQGERVVVEIESDPVGADAQYNGRSMRDIREMTRRIQWEMNPASRPVEVRLRELDALRSKGLISDDEHRTKRDAILAGL